MNLLAAGLVSKPTRRLNHGWTPMDTDYGQGTERGSVSRSSTALVQTLALLRVTDPRFVIRVNPRPSVVQAPSIGSVVAIQMSPASNHTLTTQPCPIVPPPR